MRLQKKIESNTAQKTFVISNPLKTGKVQLKKIKCLKHWLSWQKKKVYIVLHIIVKTLKVWAYCNIFSFFWFFRTLKQCAQKLTTKFKSLFWIYLGSAFKNYTYGFKNVKITTFKLKPLRYFYFTSTVASTYRKKEGKMIRQNRRLKWVLGVLTILQV
jgi:hypothetical protein